MAEIEYDLDALVMSSGDDARVLNMVTAFRDSLPRGGAGRIFVEEQIERFNREPEYRTRMMEKLRGARSMRDLHAAFGQAARRSVTAAGEQDVSPALLKKYEAIGADFRQGFEQLKEEGIDFEGDLVEQGVIEEDAWIGDADPTGAIEAETDAFYDELGSENAIAMQREARIADDELFDLADLEADEAILDAEDPSFGLGGVAIGAGRGEGANPLGVEQDTPYYVDEEILVDGEVAPSFQRAMPGVERNDREIVTFDEMMKRRQAYADFGAGEEEIIEHPLAAPAAAEDPSGGLNSRMLGAAIVGGTGLAAGLAQPFVDQYMQRDWENMLRASADGDTVARKEGALAAGRAMQGMMGASLGRRDISPALAMRNAQNASRNILQDIYGRQLVASAQERRIAEQQLAKIRSDRWQKALGTLTQVGADVGAFLGKEGAKQSAGPVTAGMKNSGGGGGDATGQ